MRCRKAQCRHSGALRSVTENIDPRLKVVLPSIHDIMCGTHRQRKLPKPPTPNVSNAIGSLKHRLSLWMAEMCIIAGGPQDAYKDFGVVSSLFCRAFNASLVLLLSSHPTIIIISIENTTSTPQNIIPALQNLASVRSRLDRHQTVQSE